MWHYNHKMKCAILYSICSLHISNFLINYDSNNFKFIFVCFKWVDFAYFLLFALMKTYIEFVWTIFFYKYNKSPSDVFIHRDLCVNTCIFIYMYYSYINTILGKKFLKLKCLTGICMTNKFILVVYLTCTYVSVMPTMSLF